MPFRLKIVGLGDSTTAGTPGFLSPIEAPPNGRGNIESQYAYWITKKHVGWTALNRGVNGERSDQILARFERDVLEEKPEYVIILAGVNDVYQGYPTSFVKNNLLKMYRMAKEAGIRVVAATILPYNTASPKASAAIAELNTWIHSTSKELGILFCDTHGAVANPKDSTRLRGSPDELHPDINGYKSMGEALEKVIARHQLRGLNL